MTRDDKNTAIYIAFDDHEHTDLSLPERGLLRAILVSAMADLRKTGEIQKKAMEYFLSPDEEYLFSFRSVCSHLQVDPKSILIVTGLADERSSFRAHKVIKSEQEEAVAVPAVPLEE